MIDAIIKNFKGIAAAIAIEKAEKKIDGKDHGVAGYDSIEKELGDLAAARMRGPISNYLFEIAHGFNYKNEEEFAADMILYANKIRAKYVKL